ncbi:M48 family metalloprotease [Pikeienuella sp. HZG-20]|uniref:M48 family metalloprotease n=1 Tax=Paludibacillus litoralis TaxID=3133267 RepID=UPI0030EEA905
MRRIARWFAATAAAAAMSVAVAAPVLAGGLIRDAEIEATLKKLSTPIFNAAGLAPDSVHFFILSDPTLNAFVFGGRNMVFHTGLLAEIKQPEGLMGVIAHETGHISGGHLTRREIHMRDMQGPMALGLLLSALAGAASGEPQVAMAGALGAQSALQRSFMAYSRSEESSADQAGATYLEKADVDPAYVLDVLKIFRDQEVFQAANVDPYAITHPLSSARMAMLEDRAAKSPAKGKSAGPELAYWHTRMRAKLTAFTDRPERTLSSLEMAPDPTSEINTLRRAIALHRLPDPAGALKAVDQLIALRPDDPFYWELKGQILFESGRGAAAVEPYRRAVALAPKEALIRGGLGRALLALDDPAFNAEALTTLEQAALGGAEEPSVLRDLALAYARAGDDGKAALATAQRFALAGAPRDALRHATRALDQLPVGSPGWLRADDIRAVAEQSLRDN